MTVWTFHSIFHKFETGEGSFLSYKSKDLIVFPRTNFSAQSKQPHRLFLNHPFFGLLAVHI